jgi:hypothetical protein
MEAIPTKKSLEYRKGKSPMSLWWWG